MVIIVLISFSMKNLKEDESYYEKVLAVDLAFVHDGMSAVSGDVSGVISLNHERNVVLDRNANGCFILVGSELDEEHKERFICGLANYESKSFIKENLLSNLIYFRKEEGDIYIGQNG